MSVKDFSDYEAPLLKMLHGTPVKMDVPFNLFRAPDRFSHAKCCREQLLVLGKDEDGRAGYLCRKCGAIYLLGRE